MHAQRCVIKPDPDNCFACKMAYWRRNGTPAVTFQGGREQFHENTIRELQDRQVAEGRANGYDPVPAERGTWT